MSIAALALMAVGANGQDSKPTLDQKLVPFLNEQRGKPNGMGLVLIGARKCSSIEIGQMSEGRFKRLVTVRPYGINPLYGPLYLEPAQIPAGEYVIGKIWCTETFNGPQARFQVRAGEFVDIGSLQIEFETGVLERVMTRKGKARRSIEPAPPEHVTALRAQAPVLMSKLVRRPMILLGPSEVEMQSRSVPR